MLELGSNVNTLSNNTQDALGRPKLVFSPIYLWMDNQYCIFPIGLLEDVEVDVVGVKRHASFKLIDIIGDKYPYPILLGVDQDFEIYPIIDFKMETMNFEVDGFRFI